ncbi:MAG: methionyl-tRNA formyltransferase [Bacteroidales bacterium]|nr:methionyl-tRNA formyltransferase [Bacteroidales bacterium]
MKIVFFGTPEFAVATLDAICQAGYEVAAVVTAPDKPAGRGQELQFSDVKKYALEKNLPILQPEKLKAPEFVEQLKQINAELFVVVAFRMMPEVVFGMPPKGTFNVHAALLPNYRGAAPIHHAVMNGETKTGVTTFFLNQTIDTGDIIAQTEVPIGDDETTGELYERLMYAGAELAIKTIESIENGTCTTYPQPEIDDPKPAPKIFKEDTLLDWNQPAKVIFNKIRGLAPFPGAYTRIQTTDGETLTLKCYKAVVSDELSVNEPGTLTVLSSKNLAVDTKSYRIFLKNIQLQGKKRMNIEDFLSGFRIEKFINKLF